MLRRTHRLIAVALSSMLILPAGVWAGDAAEAKKYLDEATKHVEAGDKDDAETSQQLAETQLDGLDEAERVGR